MYQGYLTIGQSPVRQTTEPYLEPLALEQGTLIEWDGSVQLTSSLS
jgi:hypothetical protein